MELKSWRTFQDFNDDRLTKRVIFQKDNSVVFLLNFKPGQELPPHKHPGTQVYIMVLEGSGTMTVDGSETKISKEDLVNLAGDQQLSFKNTGNEPTSLYVMLNKIPDERYAQDV